MTTMQAKSTDRRVQRTHRVLCEAVADLMQEQGWDSVTVQDICRRADVGRATFYMHYTGKEDLLAECFNDLRDGFRAQYAALDRRGGRPFVFVRALLEYAGANRPLFRSVIGRRSGQMVQVRFQQMVVELVQEELAGLAPASWPTAATTRYVAGGLVELLTWWLETRNPCSPAQVEELFQRMAGPVVAAAPRGLEPTVSA